MENSEIYDKIIAGPKDSGNVIQAWVLLGVGLYAFVSMGSFAWEMKFLIVLAIAILVHELGHLLAMKLYKYKNLKMMFLPFIGELAGGRNRQRNAFKIAMIALFGPVFGLLSAIVAAVIGMVTQNPIFFEYAYLSLLINAFNLLPIMPLDGGLFLNETLFNRFPRSEVIFKIIVILGFGYLSYLFSSWIFGVVAVFYLLLLLGSYQLPKVARDLREEEGFKGGRITVDKIARIREALKSVNPLFENDKNKEGFPDLINGVWIRANKVYPSIPVTVLLLVVYVAVSLGFSLFTWGFIHEASQALNETTGSIGE
jgi:Zn-dependent protease